MTSTIKVDNVQNTAAGKNIINESGNTVTIGASGDTVALASGASQTGFGQTYSAVAWDTTAKTTTVTGVAGVGYFINTAGGAITANLPAGTAGDVIAFADYAATWQTNNVTVVPNGSEKIGSENANATLNTEGQSVTFVYVDSTQGWINVMDSTSNVRGAPPFIVATGGTPSTCGDYKIHTFTGPGTFCVSEAGTPVGSTQLDYLVVAGAGGGAVRSPGNANGGGGGGGFRFSSETFTTPACAPANPIKAPTGLTASISAYPIVVGGGGAAISPPPASGSVQGNPGSNSVFSTITSTAGGGGGAGGGPGVGQNGGSGGGSGGGGARAAGSGNTPPVSPSQGMDGGANPGTSPDGQAGGGGGAIAVGSDATPSANGAGGAGGGLPTAFGSIGVPCGSFRYFSGGGGAGNKDGVSRQPGGAGGGGAGGQPGSEAAAGTANSGGAGGGGSSSGSGGPSGAGGSGIVVIRYKFQ